MNSNKRHLLSRILIIVGGIATVVGAVDPLEGSVLILPGSGLFALGTFLGQSERRVVAFRVLVFVLIAIGVGALWGLSAAGGFGGSTGRSMWWGVLILPYLIGLPLGIWGPGAPRWMLWLGIAVGLWYLTIFARTSARSGIHLGDAITILAALGVLIIGGCLWRLGGLGGRTAKP
jgi:hypothetical protein